MSHSKARVVHSRTVGTRGQQRATRQHAGRSTPYASTLGAQGHRLGSQDDDDQQSHGVNVAEGGDRTLESHGAHYVVSPDSTKNSKLKSTARYEEQQYKQHKEDQRERVSEMLRQQKPEVVGGSRFSGDDLRELRSKQEREQQMKAKFAPVRQRQKREEYQREKKRKEDEEISQKKHIQREKAERLKEKQEVQQQVDNEEMRRKRLARFGGGE